VTIDAMTSGTISIFSRLMNSVPTKSKSRMTSTLPIRVSGPHSQPISAPATIAIRIGATGIARDSGA
jgi:hypothetical protein